MTRSKGRRDIEERKLQIMRTATTVANTRYDSTGKPRVQRVGPAISLPRLKCLEHRDDDNEH